VVKVSLTPAYFNSMKGVSTQTFRLIIARLVGKPSKPSGASKFIENLIQILPAHFNVVTVVMSFLIEAAWSDISNSVIHQMCHLPEVGVLVKHVESLLKLEDFFKKNN
jgi:hypothetical protein